MSNQFIRTSPGFQYSVNIKFDIDDGQKISSYIPTEKAILFLNDFLASLEEPSTERARLLIGPYGTGKSHLTAVIAALLKGTLGKKYFAPIVDKINASGQPDLAHKIKDIAKGKNKYLPVIVVGNGSDFSQSLIYGLNTALKRADLSDILPDTVYRQMEKSVHRWKIEFPNTFDKFNQLLEMQFRIPMDEFNDLLDKCDSKAYKLFDELYPKLTAGAAFNPFIVDDVTELYTDVTAKLQEKGYKGVFIIYDEFNNYLETAVKKSEPINLKPLQDLAEMCNRSKEKPVHLLLVSHQHISQYAAKLSEELVNEWRKIEGRFQSIEFAQKSSKTYNLISTVILKDPTMWEGFLEKHEHAFQSLGAKGSAYRIFSELTPDKFDKWVVKGCYPLHPCTTYCLPRISNSIAQNDRTIFTFLATKEFNSLGHFLENKLLDDFNLLTIDILYDYFENLMKKQYYEDKIHRIWVQTSNALSKYADLDLMSKKIIKALAIILATGEEKNIAPTPNILKYALWAEEEEFNAGLSQLVKMKIVYIRKSDDYIEFISGSDINVYDEIARIQGNYRNKQEMKLSSILNDDFKPYPIIANRYNDEYEMTRFFIPQFFTYDDIVNVFDWNQKLINENYVDGLLALMVVEDEENLNKVTEMVRNIKQGQILFVISNKPLLLSKVVANYKAVNVLANDTVFLEKYPMARTELVAYLDDFKDVIEWQLEALIDPRTEQAKYYWKGQEINNITSGAKLSRFVSDICMDVFNGAPKINNELVNKNRVSTVVSNARIKVNHGVLAYELEANLGLKGSGPDVSIFRSFYARTGLYKVDDKSGHITINTDDMRDPNLKNVLEKIDEWILRCSDIHRSPMEVINDLRKPPYGVRLGIVPILLALSIRKHKDYLVIKNQQGVEEPLSAQLLEDIVNKPEHYLMQLEGWDGIKESYIMGIYEQFDDYITHNIETSNRLYPAALGIKSWFVSLPKFTRETSNIGEISTRLRRALKTPTLDSKELLFNRLPQTLMNDKSFKLDNCDQYLTLLLEAKTELEGHLNYVIDKLSCYLTDLFREKSEEGSSCLSVMRNWEENFGISTKVHVFKGNKNIFIENIRKFNGYDDKKFICECVKNVTGLRIEDWSDEVSESFIITVEELKKEIDEFDKRVRAGDQEQLDLVRITTVSKSGEQLERTFERVAISSLGDVLLNTLENSIDSFADAISLNEKKQVIISLLDKLDRLDKEA